MGGFDEKNWKPASRSTYHCRSHKAFLAGKQTPLINRRLFTAHARPIKHCRGDEKPRRARVDYPMLEAVLGNLCRISSIFASILAISAIWVAVVILPSWIRLSSACTRALSGAPGNWPRNRSTFCSRSLMRFSMVSSMSCTVAPLFAASQHPSEITADKQRPYLWTSQSHDLRNIDPVRTCSRNDLGNVA